MRKSWLKIVKVQRKSQLKIASVWRKNCDWRLLRLGEKREWRLLYMVVPKPQVDGDANFVMRWWRVHHHLSLTYLLFLSNLPLSQIYDSSQICVSFLSSTHQIYSLRRKKDCHWPQWRQQSSSSLTMEAKCKRLRVGFS